MLCRVPEPVRRFALEHVLFVSVGGAPGPGIPYTVVGLAVPRSRFDEVQWVVPLLDREGVGVTAAHELAHAYLGHARGTAEAEREAAELVRSWGFNGTSSDPDGCAARHDVAAERVALMRAGLVGDELQVTCTCGAGCRVLAPVVVGLPAEVGVECPRCGWVALMDVGQLHACMTCGGTAGVTWAADATPELPVATHACSCGEVATFTLRTVPPSLPAPPHALDWMLGVRPWPRR